MFTENKLEETIERLADELATQEAEQKIKQQTGHQLSTFESIKMYLKEKYIKELKMEDAKNLLSQAAQIILEEGEFDLTQNEWMHLTSQIAKSMEKLSRTLPNKVIESQEPFYQLTYLKHPDLGLIEKIANRKYFERHYAESIALYFLLATLDSQNFHFWQRLGMAYHAFSDLKKAMEAYLHALILHPEDISTRLFLVECLCFLREKDQAAKQWEMIETLIENQSEIIDKEYFKLLKEEVSSHNLR